MGGGYNLTPSSAVPNMEDHDQLRSRIADAVRRVDEESGAPAPAEIVASWQGLVERLGMTLATNPVQGAVGKTQSTNRTSKRHLLRLDLFKPRPLRCDVFQRPLLQRRRIPTRSEIVWGVTAALVASLVVGVATWRGGWRSVERPLLASSSVYTTEAGERANITLPDGSTVALNVASRLEVPADYVSGHHTVQLTGEALFTVAHSTGAPFTVTTGATTARVLGTSFVVRHYVTDTTALVAVRDGRVAVQSVVLTAQQQVVVDRGGVPHRGGAAAEAFSFASGVLTLDRVPLPDAVVELDRWYDADIRVADAPLAKARIRATFPAGSLTDLSAMLEFMLGARVVRNGRVLTLYAR